MEFNSFIALKKYNLAEECFQKYTSNGLPKEFIRWLKRAILYSAIPENLILSILSDIDLVKGEENGVWFGDDQIFKQIIIATKHIRHNGLLRRDMWKLYNRIKLLKTSLRYKCTSDAIYHYTKIDTWIGYTKLYRKDEVMVFS